MNHAFEQDLALARGLARIASEVALSQLRYGITTSLKADGTVVTEADLEVERCVIAHLAKERPADGVLGEEFGARGEALRRWIIDPIDGTFNLVAGRPDWGTHIALMLGDEVVVGVITRPELDRVWWARRAGGAHRGKLSSPAASVKLHVSDIDKLENSRVSVWNDALDEAQTRLRQHTIWVEPNLNNALELAEGSLEVLIDPTGKVWDNAPAVILVEEAGGRFSDAQGGRRIDAGCARYSNGRVHEQLERILDGASRQAAD
jgi:histidinol-phosphatase